MTSLMLKDTEVIRFKGYSVIPSEIGKIITPEALPAQLRYKDKLTMDDFNKWFKSRQMPDEREDLAYVLETYGDNWRDSHYASLTDQYWLKRRDEGWAKVNMFRGNYSLDLGNAFFAPGKISSKIKGDSPDLTTGGIVKKRWVLNYTTKQSSLVKAASEQTKQEPLNEVLASVLAEQLELPNVVSYDYHIEGTSLCSICKNFVTEDAELVPLSAFYSLIPRKENESVYDHILMMCDKLEIPGAKEHLDMMIFFDKLIHNTDRNLSNIGFLRDSSTFRFIGPAPLYDFAQSYWNRNDIQQGHSTLFGNVEDKIFDTYKHGLTKFCNVLNSMDYKNVILNYPMISESRKDKLIEGIKLSNLSWTQEYRNIVKSPKNRDEEER